VAGRGSPSAPPSRRSRASRWPRASSAPATTTCSPPGPLTIDLCAPCTIRPRGTPGWATEPGRRRLDRRSVRPMHDPTAREPRMGHGARPKGPRPSGCSPHARSHRWGPADELRGPARDGSTVRLFPRCTIPPAVTLGWATEPGRRGPIRRELDRRALCVLGITFTPPRQRSPWQGIRLPALGREGQGPAGLEEMA